MSIGNAIKISLNKNLKKLRKSSGLSIPELDKRLNLGQDAIKQYEIERSFPPLEKMIKIAAFFGVSADFLLLWDQIKYPRSIRLLSLAEDIDKMDVDKWHKVEATAATFLGEEQANRTPEIVFDNPESELTDNIHKNIQLLRKRINFTQAQLGRYLNQATNHISNYETGKAKPPAENLILMSVLFETSIHALATGRKLYFNFRNEDFKDTMLNADHYLDLEKKNFICEMMEKIIEGK